jgi:hypothetical protein
MVLMTSLSILEVKRFLLKASQDLTSLIQSRLLSSLSEYAVVAVVQCKELDSVPFHEIKVAVLIPDRAHWFLSTPC